MSISFKDTEHFFEVFNKQIDRRFLLFLSSFKDEIQKQQTIQFSRFQESLELLLDDHINQFENLVKQFENKTNEFIILFEMALKRSSDQMRLQGSLRDTMSTLSKNIEVLLGKDKNE